MLIWSLLACSYWKCKRCLKSRSKSGRQKSKIKTKSTRSKLPSLRQNYSGLRTNCVTTTPFLFTLHWVFSQSLPTTEIRLSRLPMLLRNTQSRHPIKISSKDLLGLINWATLNYIHWANSWIRNVQVEIYYFSQATTKALKHILVVHVTLWGRSYFVQGRS